MSSSSEGPLSLGSLNQTRPVRSQTYMRPLFSNAIPTASVHGPDTLLSVNPAGTFAPERSPIRKTHKTINPNPAIINVDFFREITIFRSPYLATYPNHCVGYF